MFEKTYGNSVRSLSPLNHIHHHQKTTIENNNNIESKIAYLKRTNQNNNSVASQQIKYENVDT